MVQAKESLNSKAASDDSAAESKAGKPNKQDKKRAKAVEKERKEAEKQRLKEEKKQAKAQKEKEKEAKKQEKAAEKAEKKAQSTRRWTAEEISIDDAAMLQAREAANHKASQLQIINHKLRNIWSLDFFCYRKPAPIGSIGAGGPNQVLVLSGIFFTFRIQILYKLI